MRAAKAAVGPAAPPPRQEVAKGAEIRGMKARRSVSKSATGIEMQESWAKRHLPAKSNKKTLVHPCAEWTMYLQAL